MIGFLRDNGRWIAGGALLTYLSSFGQTFFVSASVGEWRAAFDLSHGDFGLLYMAATLASAACLPFLGKVVDVWPQHRIILITGAALAVGMVLAASAPSVLVLTAAIFLLRLFGQGMMPHIALTATGRWFAANRGRAVSFVVLGHQGGEATLPLLFAALAIAFGYQAGWFAGAAFLVVLGAPLAAWAYAKPRTPRGHAPVHVESGRNWTRREVLRDPVFWVLLTGVLAPPFIGTTLFFHQDYLTELREWPPALFAQGLAVMAAATVIVVLINGAVIDRFGSIAVLPVFLLPLGTACFVGAASASPAVLFVFMALMGVSYGVSSTLFGALWPEIYGAKHLGAVRSVIVAAMTLATAAGPGLTGMLIDAGVALPQQMIGFGVYCVAVSGALALASQRLQRRALEAPCGEAAP